MQFHEKKMFFDLFDFTSFLLGLFKIFWPAVTQLFTELPKETQIPAEDIIDDEKTIAQEDIISDLEIIMEISLRQRPLWELRP